MNRSFVYLAIDGRTATLPNTGHNRRLPWEEADSPRLRHVLDAGNGGDVLAEHLMKTINDLNELAVTVPGVIADNGANMQATLASLESEQRVLPFRCQAHSIDLLL